ncbi:MAG: hypothetical protein ACMUIE_10495 [Thermoplasmatota archaeon]
MSKRTEASNDRIVKDGAARKKKSRRWLELESSMHTHMKEIKERVKQDLDEISGEEEHEGSGPVSDGSSTQSSSSSSTNLSGVSSAPMGQQQEDSSDVESLLQMLDGLLEAKEALEVRYKEAYRLFAEISASRPIPIQEENDDADSQNIQMVKAWQAQMNDAEQDLKQAEAQLQDNEIHITRVLEQLRELGIDTSEYERILSSYTDEEIEEEDKEQSSASSSGVYQPSIPVQPSPLPTSGTEGQDPKYTSSGLEITKKKRIPATIKDRITSSQGTVQIDNDMIVAKAKIKELEKLIYESTRLLEDLKGPIGKIESLNKLKNQMEAEVSKARAFSDRAISSGFRYQATVYEADAAAPETLSELSYHIRSKQIETKDDLDQHIKDLEEELNTIGDDSQLANIDLQNMLQKQQQTIQMLSSVSKVLHDTALAVIRKIG